MSKSQKWRERQRAYEAGQLHEWHAAQEAAPTPPPKAAPPPANPFDAAYGDRPITPEAAYWDNRGYMRWQLTTHYAGSRLAFNRNPPNG